MDEEDLQIEDLLANTETTKKKVDGKAKGDRTELNLCKFLSKYFDEEFSKALGSGSRWSQVKHLPEHAKKTLIGDICVPEKFTWVIECKGGYEKEMNMSNICEGVSCLDEFIEQVTRDAEYCGRKPIVMWKRNRKPWLSIIKEDDCKGFDFKKHWANRVCYNGWVMGQLQVLLDNTSRNFWFGGE